MNTAWIVLGLVFFLVVIDWMIGKHTIKRCEAEMVNALKHAEKLKEETMAEVDEKVNKYEAEVGNFKTEVRQAAEILSEFITHELYLKPETKPAEVKLTLDFKGMKK